MKINCNKKILITILMVILFVVLLRVKVFAADDETNPEFTLASESIDVYLNQSKYISYSGGDVMEDIVWTSADQTIATVNQNGYVTGLKIGTTTITATRGSETATCEVNVVYCIMRIGANYDDSVNRVSLVLNEHETETLYATVTDYDSNNITDAQIEWTSSDSSIVTVEKETGVLKAKKVGTATITATAAGVSDTCEVVVSPAPEFTDFSNAKYELLFDTDTDLKISGIIPKENGDYRYVITSTNQKPSIALAKYGGIDYEQENLESLIINTEEKYMYDRYLDKYVELNQELYLWVIEDVRLENSYYTENQENISHATKFVVEGQKLTRPELPQLNLILKSFNLSCWHEENDSNEYVSMNFRFPSATENRKFSVKIGKVTDNEILKKIQNNDYSGITDLLTYAKNNEAVYTSDLTTTSENYFWSEQVLFDGNSLLTDDAYYYIYVVFDDENGKYYPIQGITLGQAYLSEISDYWNLYAYTSEKFQWNNLSPTPTEPPKDTSTAPTVIPNAGSKMMIAVIMLLAVSGLSIVFYKKSKKLRDII